MREVALAREIREAGVSEMGYLYMGSYPSVLSSLFFFTIHHQGFYIHSCQKMRYKGEYSPSYLADPVCVSSDNYRMHDSRRPGNVPMVSNEGLHPPDGKIPLRMFF